MEAYRYNAYGQPLQASKVGNPYMFTGRRFDSETGLYYYRNRHYSPQLRRFIEPDPIGFEGGMNLYAYVGNDPENAVDPWGLFDVALTPYAAASAPFIAMADSPFLPFGDALAGALIGLAYLHDTWPEENTVLLSENSSENNGSCSNHESTPSTDPDDFDPWRGAKKNKKTGEIWKKDPSRHGGDHYEVYKNGKMFEKGFRDRAVWRNGRLKQKW